MNVTAGEAVWNERFRMLVGPAVNSSGRNHPKNYSGFHISHRSAERDQILGTRISYTQVNLC